VGGAAAGFLVYNAPPARIFMGDCGSLVLGYVLAVLGLAVQEGAAPVPALVPILIVAVPLFDTTFVSLTRTWRGQSVTNGGTDHTMHRLTRLRWSERRPRRMVWVCEREPMGLARSRRMASTPAMKVVATAPRPGVRTRRLPSWGVIAGVRSDIKQRILLRVWRIRPGGGRHGGEELSDEKALTRRSNGQGLVVRRTAESPPY